MQKATYAELFSKSLEVATGESGLYRCPLCLAAFDVGEADSLTWDHYPPRSIGGRDCDTVLVCKECHRQWSRTDAELVPLTRREEFDQLYPCMEPIILRIPDEPYVQGLTHREAIDIGEDSIRLFGRPEHNAEEATQRLTKFLSEVASEGKWDGLRMTVSTDRALTYSGHRVERSFLKAAYLAAFDCLGYPYVLSQALDIVRQQVQQPEATFLAHHTLTFSPQPPGFDRQILLAYMHMPEPLTGLAVFLLGYKLARWCITFLPLPTHAGLPRYGELGQVLHEAGHMEFVIFERSRELITDGELTLVDRNAKEWPIYRYEDI